MLICYKMYKQDSIENIYEKIRELMDWSRYLNISFKILKKNKISDNYFFFIFFIALFSKIVLI